MPESEVRYVERDGRYLAYSVFGEGRTDLAVSQARFPIDLMWEWPQLAAFMEALGRLARVIVWDPRGVGASDPDPNASSSIESFADDTLAVLRAAGCDRASHFELGTAGSAIAYAATYPDRVQSMILVNVRRSYPELAGLSDSERRRVAMHLRSQDWLEFENPRVAHDPEVQRWWGHVARLTTTPDQMADNLSRAGDGENFDPVFAAVRTPTLVLHRRGNRVWDIESSRAAASLIPSAQFVELPGAENDIFLGDTGPVLSEIERFLAAPVVAVEQDRVLATVLFTDIVASTEQLAARGDAAWRRALDDHDQTMERIVTDYRGRVVKSTGDGILATFDGPARAVRCAQELLDAAKSQGITLRAGLHTGEIELRPSDLAGIAVHIANRIATLAGPNETLVSRTVVDLTAGSDLRFEPQGEHQLKGVPGTWPIFTARLGSAESA
jgi:class 3 adenylate cyclase